MAKSMERGFRGLRETMERCSEIVTQAYSLPVTQLAIHTGELPPGHRTTDRRQRYWVSEHNGDMIVALPGTTHPLDWSSNLRVTYKPVDGSVPAEGATTEQLEGVPCAHAGFFYRAETVPTLQLLQQAAERGCRLVLTGHSLGGAVANLCALTALMAQRKAAAAAAAAATAARVAVGSSRSSRRRARKAKAKAQLSGSRDSSSGGSSGDLVSPQAALVDVLCVSFASPVYANAALAHMIEANGWEECFVNVVVPEDYCLKLFNNVLTSAPQPAGSPAGSRCGSFKSTRLQVEYSESLEPLEQEAIPDPFEAAAAAAAAGAEPSSSGGGSMSRRFSYQGQQQPLASAMARKDSAARRSKRQLSFAQPVHQAVASDASVDAAADAAAVAAAAAAAAAEDDKLLMEPLPGIAISPNMCEPSGSSDGGWWGAMPSSPSSSSLVSDSSLSSTRSWRLLAYLPDMLSRSFSGRSLSTSGSASSTSSSETGTVVSDAGSAASSASGSPLPPAVGSASDRWHAMRHARSTADLGAHGGLSSSDSGSSDSSLASLDDLQATNVVRGMAEGQQQQQQQQHQQLQAARPHSGERGLRRSVSSASLLLRNRGLLQPLASVARLPTSVANLLPSMRAVVSASRCVVSAASNLTSKALNVPLDVLEVGLVKALRPPMYQPVGQQWVLSATGLVPQHQPITQYPRHVHDVFWHKELMLVAFREHSIVFYKQRLLQQASRR